MRSLKPGVNVIWFVEIAVLPFIRRYEFRHRWYGMLFSGAIVSLALVLLLSVFDPDRSIPDSVKVVATVVGVFFFLLLLLLSMKFPLSKGDRGIYRDLVSHGVFLDDGGVTINAYSLKDRRIPYDSINSFHVKVLESSGNTEVISFDTSEGEVILPFLNLTDSKRIPIPGFLSDQGSVYYCYQPDSRCEVTADNNDFYQELKKRLADREQPRRLERIKFQCPGCNELFLIQTYDWHMRKRDILYCSECSNLVSLDTAGEHYQKLFSTLAGQGESSVISRKQNLVTFKGTVAVEPKEYSFEIVQGDVLGFDRIEKRSPDFQRAMEEALLPCSCGGRFSYQALPRCPFCRRTIPELVEGLGYGRYAVITQQNEGEACFRDT